MKKGGSQIAIALVCVLLGYLLIHQFKAYSSNTKALKSTDILSEIEQLKSEKEELSKTHSELSEELKKYEEDASSETTVGQEIKRQLDNSRIELGLVSVAGPGVEITLNKKTAFFGGNFSSDEIPNLTANDLIHIINILWYARAEAIEINDFRITPQTGIKDSGNSISIGSAGKINPGEKIIIKVIGDGTLIKHEMSFKPWIEYGTIRSYDIVMEEKEEIIIDKSMERVNAEYLNPVEKVSP